MQRLSTSKLGCCQHKKHLRLENLRTLILADNRLDKIPLYHLADGDSSRLIKLFGFLSLKRLAFSSPSGKKALLIITSLFFSTLSSNDENEAPGLTTQKQKIMFPTLSMMDLSNNRLELDCTYCKVFPSFWSNFPNFRIHEVPANIHELTNLSVLNLSGNQKLTELPPQMGLLHKLWNLNTRGCNLQEPLATMMNSKAYKTSDVIGYLRSLWKFWWINQKIKIIWLSFRSVLENSKLYARLKLMVVGIQGIGKTTLLELLRQVNYSHWVFTLRTILVLFLLWKGQHFCTT